jgi:hypothetical protein
MAGMNVAFWYNLLVTKRTLGRAWLGAGGGGAQDELVGLRIADDDGVFVAAAGQRETETSRRADTYRTISRLSRPE